MCTDCFNLEPMKTFQISHRDCWIVFCLPTDIRGAFLDGRIPHRLTRHCQVILVGNEIFPSPHGPNSSTCIQVTSYCVCVIALA